jgi:hypothetical protein
MDTPTKLFWVDTEDRSHNGWITLPRGFLPTTKNFVIEATKNLKGYVRGLQEVKIMCIAPNGDEVVVEIEPHDQLTVTGNQPKIGTLQIIGTTTTYYAVEITFARNLL